MTDETTVTRTPIPMLSPAAERLIGIMRATEEGVTLTYSELEAAAGFDIREKRGVMNTAKNRVLVDDGMHFAVVRGVGYMRLTQAEAAESMSADLTKARRAARRGTKKAQRIDLLEVPADRRPSFVARATLCELITESTKAGKQNRLAALASKQGESTAILAQREALEALKSGT